jgi:hypothetical protein
MGPERVHVHACRLVDDDELFVLVDDHERKLLGRDPVRGEGGQIRRDRGIDLVIDAPDAFTDAQCAGGDQISDRARADRDQVSLGVIVEPQLRPSA